MAYWRSAHLWLLLLAGWLIASTFFGVLARLFASFDDMTRAESWITGIAIHLFAALAGFSYARTSARRDAGRGFPVVAERRRGREPP